MSTGRSLRRRLTRAAGLTILLLASLGRDTFASTNLSAWIYPAPGGRLVQQPDALGNRILDYTSVGYKGGLVPLPIVPVKTTVSPIAGDDTANIQSAINLVSAMPLDTNGFRGAVLLTAGEYQLNGSVTINTSGVVLRGEGSGTNGTVLRATATNQYSLVRITGSGSATTVGGTTHNVTNNYIPVGATSFNVDSTSGLAAGDRVFVRRIATTNWIHDLGMDLLDNPWTPDGYNIDMDRIITRIEGNRIFINAPLTCAIEKKYAGGTIRKYTWTSRITNCGVEHLRGVSDFTMVDDENHGWILVQFNSVENAWARNVTSQFFGYACVAFYGGTRFATASDCRSLDPVSIVTGGRRYAFVLDDCTFCLVRNCYTDEDRHQFVTQSLTTGPNVFVDGLSDTAKSDAGPHHRWGTGALWDSVTVNGNALDIQNRGNLGSGHGWSGANEVAYNCFASSGYVVQKPPGAHNWLIGSIGSIKNGTVYVGPHDPGDYDSSGSSATNVFPNSLYYSQLQDRLAAPGLQTREYWLGEITRFTNSVAPGEIVPVDPAWNTAVSAVIGPGAAINGFDVVSSNQWVPFTFNFNLATNEQIIAATLSLSMCAASGASSNDVLYLDSTTNGFTLASLGWNAISTASTNPTVRALDLSSQIARLSDGKLNVAVQNDLGIDWALLELEVAPLLVAGTNVLYPVADATVRGGTSANSNFGTATTLTVKEDSSNDNDRKAYLRWDLSGLSGTIYQARIRLTPVSIGVDGIEQGVTVSTSNSWNETGLTWNNQPGGGKRFATWIPGTNAPLEFVVTPQVLDAMAGDKQLSVQLYSIRNFGASGIVDYASRESTDPNARPQLRLFMAGAAPAISDLTNQTVAVNGSVGPIPFIVADATTPAGSLVLSGNSSDTNLVPPGGIVFGGSGSNRTVTLTPGANQSGITTIAVTVTDTDGLSASDVFSLTVGNHAPGVFIWNGPGAGANNWSLAGNWTPAGPPEAFDAVKFFDLGGSGVVVSNVNNSVDATFGGTIGSLQYGNTNGNHTTLIPAGKTLNVIGSAGLTVGTETDNGNTQVVNATMTGPSGTLNLSGGNLTVRQATDPSSSSQRATLDLSGVGTITANIGRVLIGTEGVFARPTGTLLLGKTNFITATGSSPAIAVGGAGGGSGNAGSVSHIHLGQTNVIFTDSISIGRVKQGLSGGASSSLRFNASFTNANPALGPVAVFRAADGMNRIATWNIADSQSQGGTVNTAGTCDFTGGTVDALVDTLIVARSSTGSGAGNPAGTLVLHAGRIDVNTLHIGVQGSATANNGTNFATGTVNVNGGALSANSILRLGITAGGVGVPSTRGVLNINGGIVCANSLTAGDGTNNTIAISGGSLFLTNDAGPGINLLALTNATLTVPVSGSTPPLTVTNLVTGGAPTVIHFRSLPVISENPAQFAVIKYSGSIGGSGFNFTRGSLPPGIVCGGFLSNNLASHSVDVVLTNCVAADPFVTWNGDVNGDWDASTPNWQNNLGPGLAFAPGNAVVFNDAATGETDVNLIGTLAPSSVMVSNQVKSYSFVGLGSLTGSASLTKRGAGELIIANSGANDFTGGVSIEAGALQVGAGDADGNLPDGPITNLSALIFNLSDDVAINSVISGTGVVVQEGPNELSLNGANSYSGITTIKTGTVRAGDSAALGSALGLTIITNGGTLDVNGFSLGAEAVIVSGGGITNTGAIVNRGASQTTALRTVTLAGHTTFGGTGRWDIRNSGGAASLLTGGQPFNLTKVGSNQVSLVGVNPVDPALGDIDVQEGMFAIQTSTAQLGDSNKTITVSGGATLNVYRLTNSPLNKRIVFNDGATMFSENDSNLVVGPVTLAGQTTFNVNNSGGAPSLTFAGTLAGPGGVTKIGTAPLVLLASNSYTGLTRISAGTLALRGAGSITGSTNITVIAGATVDAGGRVDGTLTLANGQSMNGNGAVTGNLTANNGAVVSPGTNAIGTLTASGAVLLNGTTFMKLNLASLTNDVLQAGGLMIFGGTLMLTNLSGTLQAGNSFKLFYATNYTGAFNSLVPAIPASGLKWETNLLGSNGILRIASAPPVITSVTLFGSGLVMTGINGSPGSNYFVLTATNLALPLTNWLRLATNAFDGSGNFVFTNALNPAVRERFYLIQTGNF